jgi:dolichol kinase
MSTVVENSIEEQSFALRSDLHITRKLWHMGTGLIGLFVYHQFQLSANSMAWGLMSLAIVAILVEVSRLKIPAINKIVLKVMKPFLRESERNSMSGFPFYALGISLSFLMFDEKIAVLSALFLMFSDPISSLFGILYGKDKIIGNKSLQGAMAGFIVCYALTFLYGAYYFMPGVELLVFSLVAGVIGSVSELCSIVVDDNLSIPVVSGLGITLLNFIIPIF